MSAHEADDRDVERPQPSVMAQDVGLRKIFRTGLLETSLAALEPLFESLSRRDIEAQQRFERFLEKDERFRGVYATVFKEVYDAENYALAGSILVVADTFAKHYLGSSFLNAAHLRRKYGAHVPGTKVPFGAAIYAGANVFRHFMEWSGDEPHPPTKRILDALGFEAYDDSVCLKILRMNDSMDLAAFRSGLERICDSAEDDVGPARDF